MIKIEDVYYRYKEKDSLFELNVSFEIQAGECAMLVGESGGGKSTLLALLGGYLLPDTGRIYINSKDARFLRPHERDMAIIFQEHNLFAHLSILENLKIVGNKIGLKDEDLRGVAARFHLGGLESRIVSTLSGGQIQRAALARCYIQHKKILLLDEAFSSLDPSLRTLLLEEVYTIHKEKGLTVLFTTHIPLEGKKYATRVIFLHEGRILYDGTVKGFFNSKKEEVKKYLKKMECRVDVLQTH